MSPRADRAVERNWGEEIKHRQEEAATNARLRAAREDRAWVPIPHAMEGFGIQFRIFAGIILAVVIAGLILYLRQKG